MTALGNTARANGVASKAAWDAIGADIDALPTGGGGALTWPTGRNCIPGTQPSGPFLVPGDTDSGAVNLTYYDRLCDGMPSGSVMFFGDSLTQAMPVCAASPFGINLGYGGRSTRRLIHHMIRPQAVAAMQRAGALVIFTGAVDLGNTTYYTDPLTNPGGSVAAAATVVGMMAGQFKTWFGTTSKVVIVLPIRGDQRVAGFPAGYNTSIDYMRTNIAAAYSGVAGVAVVDATPALIDGTGNLATANHIGDGQHLSKAGDAILCPQIASALSGLGVQ